MRVIVSAVDIDIDAHKILDSISFEAQSNRTTALIGPNGSGKSTLLRAVYRAAKPTMGTVLIGDSDIWQTPAKAVARQRAVVTQHQGAGTDFTVREIVAMGRSPHKGYFETDNDTDRRLIDNAMSIVHVYEFAQRPFSTLSGGERQRVLLARALAQQAPVIILDEPTNHLDVRAQFELLDLLENLETTVLLAMHDLDHALAHADTIAVLDRGRIVAVGEPRATLTPALLLEVFGVDALVIDHPITGRPHVAMALPPSSRHT
ncbi:ABC transporter ATP-binding protein [Rhodococcoides fascians]|uniref:ABC transporter ATP-binding protein n=1 Tax=Rhodococcoides fascians TaxID=1828 RepID=UPI000B9BF566|nr:ABC transporter ATP-binding protein [Rhodococcus fascians]OZE85306.1 ABC transporter ATP-binding protein [Rhodococcus fascians]OZF11813.1 ABC transporter ATP-binding protein [Rhodococcus fascians]OZF14582.1 ABC transporter ATP-binding protein [Rhodococcus fascians]OZF71357.1 ABC transporter ATP-binding protein [Rhodococcus fascians]OZF72828.1 ABC transporter ATP-binding protein [Rhodococcus fascians]